MKGNFWKTLALRYIGCVFCILLLSISIVSAYFLNSQQETELTQNTTSNRRTLEHVANVLEDWTNAQIKIAQIMAQSPTVVEACKKPENSELVEKAQKYLQTYHNKYGFYENIPLAAHLPKGKSLSVTVNGKSRVVKDGTFFTDTVGGKTIGKGGAHLSFIKASRSGKEYFISQVYPSILRGNPIFVISIPVYDNSKHVGSLILAPQMDYFTNKFINNSKIGKTGSLFFLDSRGIFIAHKDPAMILKKDLGDHTGYIQKILNGEDNFFSTDATTEKYKYLVQPISISKENILHKWILCATQAESEITAGSHKTASAMLYAGGGLLIALGLLLYLLTRFFVTKPLAEIGEYARQIENGNLNAKLAFNSTTELGTLADSLRNMNVTIIGELQDKMSFMQGLLNGIQNPYAVVNANLELQSCNNCMIEIAGRSGNVEDFVGWNISKFLFDDPSRYVILIDVMKDNTPRINKDFSYTNPIGKNYELVIDVVPLCDTEGNVTGGITFWNNVSELKARQKEMEAHKKEIEAAATQAHTLSDKTEDILRLLTENVEQSNTRTEKQKEYLLETITAIDELSATVQEIASNSSQTANTAQVTKENADSGAGIVQDSMQSIHSLQKLIATMSDDIDKLTEHADGIGNVMEIINDIADQTNLLALNAAIEAARAGEAGRGFSVVADEVRKLAEKTMSATSEVDLAVTAIQNGTKNCAASIKKVDTEAGNNVARAKDTEEALTGIRTMTESTSQMVTGIATAAEQQSAATEQVARTASDIGTIAEETYSAMQSATLRITEVKASFEELRNIIYAMK